MGILAIAHVLGSVDGHTQGRGTFLAVEVVEYGCIVAANWRDVIIVASKAQYAPLADMLKAQGAASSEGQRRWFAKEAFQSV